MKMSAPLAVAPLPLHPYRHTLTMTPLPFHPTPLPLHLLGELIEDEGVDRLRLVGFDAPEEEGVVVGRVDPLGSLLHERAQVGLLLQQQVERHL